ncbi:MAG TPA: L-aspartate oxidase [Acidimicrobiia bacterium]|nr:L-aspartate oxidase [Acidimicrobiia bacterium]
MYDVVVLGSGVAGLAAAIRAGTAGLSVLVLTKAGLTSSTTRYAQGGVAAALTEADSPELHFSDTLAAGADLCDADAVRVLVTEGPARIRELVALGAEFDRTGDGAAASFALAREGGHSVARVAHAGGDATGAEIERALVAAVAELAGVEVRERWFSAELVIDGDRCAGVSAIGPSGATEVIAARHTILATGGAGQMFAVTTNPAVSTGDGIAMAARVGAAIADVEFVQFHPTALHHPESPRPLLSEALRGEGAVLRDHNGHAFMADEHPLGDLAPRDVVARAVTVRLLEAGVGHLWLDATSIDDFPSRFPTIWATTGGVGLDPTRDWLPVAPAAHYACGGVATDLDGATTVPGLWACGEVACSGVHGANRLASNSLLDGLVFAPRVVDAIERGQVGPGESGVLRGMLAGGWRGAAPLEATGPEHTPGPRARAAGGPDGAELTPSIVQHTMTADAGVLRDAASLDHAAMVLAGPVPNRTIGERELANLTMVARMVVSAARAREETRGTHSRLDFPDPSAQFLGRFVVGRARGPELVMLPREVPA